MKKILPLILILTIVSTVMAQSSSYATSRGSGTIMISGAGTYTTNLDQDLKSSNWNLGVDGALFLFPQFAAGMEFGYAKDFTQTADATSGDITDFEDIDKYFGPRVYLFLGGKNSELTPFVKMGANYSVNKKLENDKELELDAALDNYEELGLTASAGLLLNLAKNVGLSVEAEYNFARGTAVEDIDTKELLIKFGIRSFLSD